MYGFGQNFPYPENSGMKFYYHKNQTRVLTCLVTSNNNKKELSVGIIIIKKKNLIGNRKIVKYEAVSSEHVYEVKVK